MEDTLELVVKIKHSTYNKERYEASKDYILKYRKIDNFSFLAEKYFLAGVLSLAGVMEHFIFCTPRIFSRLFDVPYISSISVAFQ